MGSADTKLAKTGADFADVLERAAIHAAPSDETVEQRAHKFFSPNTQQWSQEELHAFRGDLVRAGHISKTTDRLSDQIRRGNERAAAIARSLRPFVQPDGFSRVSDEDMVSIMRTSRQLAGLELADEALRGDKQPVYEGSVQKTLESLADTGELPKVSTLLGGNPRYEDQDPLLQKDVDISKVQEDAQRSADRWTYFARWQALLSELASKSSASDRLQSSGTNGMQDLYRIDSPRGFSSVPVAESYLAKSYHVLFDTNPEGPVTQDSATVHQAIDQIKDDLATGIQKQATQEKSKPSSSLSHPVRDPQTGKPDRRWS
jgi:hypothetical protein